MIDPGYVGVGEPATATKRIDNTTITNPDTVVVERQIIGTGDPENWADIARVLGTPPAAAAAGLVTRNIQAGNSDSGLVPIPAVEGQLTDVDTQVIAVLLFNVSSTVKKVTLKNDLGAIYLNEYPLPARTPLALAFHGAVFASGIRWNAGAVDGEVNGQVVGNQ